MSTGSAKRLLIPAQRPASREVLVPVAPYFLRDPAQVPVESEPRILAFETDGFMEDFLGVAGGTRTLPRLLPWRDWSEPPEAMLDSTGAKTYPNTLARRPPEPWEIESEPAAGMDADGVPRDPAGGPAWLRKLYLPLHERFNLVAFDLVCQAPGWPRLARGRVLGAGTLIRRLARDRADELWEDWVALDDKHGAWLPLLDARMRPPTAPAAPRAHVQVDPAALPVADLDPGAQTALGALLGVAPRLLPNVALTSQPLTLVPPDAGPAAQHCTLFGYLPVFSGAQEQVGGRLSLQSVSSIAAALADQTHSALSGLFAQAPALRAQAAPHLRTLLVHGLLPPLPADAGAARSAILGFVPAGSTLPFTPPANQVADLDAQVDRVLVQALHRLLIWDGEPVVVAAAIAGSVPTPAELWHASTADLAARQPGLASGWLGATLQGRPDAWDTLARVRLHQVADAWVSGAGIPAPPGGPGDLATQHLWGLTALAVLRLRACRLALAAYLARTLGWGLGEDRFTAVDSQGDPVCTAAALGEEIAAILTAEAERADPRTGPPWPPISLAGLADSARLLRVHQAAEALTEVYAGFDATLGQGGAATARQIALRIGSVTGIVGAALATGTRSLRNRGLGLGEQPALALLIVPGWGASQANLDQFRDQAAALYTAAPNALALPEARTRETAPRLRFDADHLYAAWCWVRVAGHGPCEPPRVIWTGRSDVFAIADPTDLLGGRPAVIKMPDIPKLLKDLPRLAKAKARPFAAMTAPDRSGIVPGAEMADTQRDWGIGFICSFGIPILTICAMVLFSIIFSILVLIPGFAWMLLLKFCIPFPKRSS